MVARGDPAELAGFRARGNAATATHRVGGTGNGLSVFGNFKSSRKRKAAAAALTDARPAAVVTDAPGDPRPESLLQVIARADQHHVDGTVKEFRRDRHEELEEERRCELELKAWSDIALSARPPDLTSGSQSAVIGDAHEDVRQVPEPPLMKLQTFALGYPAEQVAAKGAAVLGFSGSRHLEATLHPFVCLLLRHGLILAQTLYICAFPV